MTSSPDAPECVRPCWPRAYAGQSPRPWPPLPVSRATGVCEINTHPTRRQCRTPPMPPNVNVHGHAQGECNWSVKQTLILLAAVMYLCVNFEIRVARGREFENTSDIELSIYFTDTSICVDSIFCRRDRSYLNQGTGARHRSHVTETHLGRPQRVTSTPTCAQLY